MASESATPIYEDVKYLKGNYPPLRTPDPEKKDYYYFLRNCEAIYSTFYKSGAAVPFSSVRRFLELKAFAQGLQPSDFYKDYLSRYRTDYEENILDPTMGFIGKRKGKAKGFMRAMWDVLSPMPNIMDSMVGTLTKTRTDIRCDALDPISKEKQADAKLKLWVDTQHAEDLQQAYQMAWLKMQEMEFQPENELELELYEQLGGFRPAYTRVMEKLVSHTMDISDWDYIEQRLYRDYITYNVFGVRVYYEPETGKYKLRPADPIRSGIQYSEFNDCRTSEWAYEFTDVSITKLVQEFPDKDFEFFRDIAQRYCGYMNNPSQSEWGNYSTQDANGFMKFDFFKVPVLTCYWYDDEGEQQVSQSGKYNTKVFSAPYGDKVPQTDGKKSRFKMRRFCYGATWVIGTELIYQWGKTYDNFGESHMPFHFYVGDGNSKVHQVIPLIHNFQVLWLKYVNALAMAVNSGYWINVDMLANVAVGGDEGGKENDKEMANRRFLESGIGYYSRVNAVGQANLTDMPVHEFRGGMGQIFLDILAAFQFNKSMFESITGVNPIVLGQTPDPNAPVGTTQMAVSAVSSVLKPIIDAHILVKKNVCKDICRLVHISVNAYPFSRDAYRRVIGEFDMEVLLSADRDSTEYGVQLDIRPGDMEKQAMIQAIQQAAQTDRDGATGGISGLEAVILIRRLESGVPMSQIEFEFEYRRRKNLNDAQRRAQENAQQQGAIIQQQQQQAAQLGEQASQAQHQRDMELQSLKNQGLMQNTELQEAMRASKENTVAQIKTDATKYVSDNDSRTKQTSDYIKQAIEKAKLEDKKKEEKAA